MEMLSFSDGGSSATGTQTKGNSKFNKRKVASLGVPQLAHPCYVLTRRTILETYDRFPAMTNLVSGHTSSLARPTSSGRQARDRARRASYFRPTDQLCHSHP